MNSLKFLFVLIFCVVGLTSRSQSNRVTASAFTDTAKSTKIYLLIVADTKDSSIGKSAGVDMKNIEEDFKLLFDKFKLGKPITTTISGDNVRKGKVESAIADALSKVTPQDIFVFYFSGHGFRFADDTSRFPRMKLWPWNEDKDRVWQGDSLKRNFVKENSLTLDEVYNAIKNKKNGVARLNLIISDCCNTMQLQTSKPMYTDKKRGEAAVFLKKSGYENFSRLFMDQKPKIVRMTATDIDQIAPAHPEKGGYFTQNFISTLFLYLDSTYTAKPINWDNLCQRTIERSATQAKTVINPKGVRFKIDPFYKIPD